MSNLLISPHNDDETLFAAFTLCREAADIQVVVIFDGYVQAARGEPVMWWKRREETEAALRELGVVKPPIFAGFSDAEPDWEKVNNLVCDAIFTYDPVKAYYPHWEDGGHHQHNRLSVIANQQCCNHRVNRVGYMTYTTGGKSVGGTLVHPHPDYIIRKLRALACYRSQIGVENCREHFMRGLHEYYA